MNEDFDTYSYMNRRRNPYYYHSYYKPQHMGNPSYSRQHMNYANVDKIPPNRESKQAKESEKPIFEIFRYEIFS